MLKFLLELDICPAAAEWRCFCAVVVKGDARICGVWSRQFLRMFDLCNIMVKRTRFKKKMSQSNNNLKKVRKRRLNCAIAAALA